MIQVILFLAQGWLLTGVDSLRNISQTPGVVAAETLVKPPQDICSTQELAEMLNLRPGHELVVTSRTRLDNGSYRVKLEMRFNNVSFRGFHLAATQLEDGSFNGAVSGYIPNTTNVETAPSISPDDLSEILINYVNAANQRPEVKDACVKDLDEVTFVKQIIFDQTTGRATLVYYIRAVLLTSVLFRWPRVVVDAVTRKVIQGSVQVSLFKDQFQKDNLKDNSDEQKDDIKDKTKLCPSFKGGNDRCTSYYGPGPDEVCLDASVDGRYTVLASDSVVVLTLNNGISVTEAKVVEFPTETGPDDAVNGASAPGADAYHCAMKALELYREWGQETLDLSTPLHIYLHVGMNFSNSYYFGSGIALGDGNDVMYPTTECEAVGHEIGHYIIDSMRNMAMRDESISVAEGFCDIFAKSLSAFLCTDGAVNNWIFADCVVREGNQRIRFFDEPSKDGYGIDNYSVYEATTDADYRALGIMTKCFYCLVETKGMTVKDVFRTFVFANKIYWDENTGLADAACGVYRAASDLQLNTNNLFECFKSVGIDLFFCSLAGTKT